MVVGVFSNPLHLDTCLSNLKEAGFSRRFISRITVSNQSKYSLHLTPAQTALVYHGPPQSDATIIEIFHDHQADYVQTYPDHH